MAMGPFIINGQVEEMQNNTSEIDTESTTAIIFNLDRLNEERSEQMQGINWPNGLIPKSLDSFVESLV